MRGTVREHYRCQETIITFVAPPAHLDAARKAILAARFDLEGYIRANVEFRHSLVPLEPGPDAPLVVKRLCGAGNAAGAGPMSAVAGTIASTALEAMLEDGAKEAVVDNGGDIAVACNEPVLVGIYSGEGDDDTFALEVNTGGKVLGICSSSAKIGPSISLGKADCVTVIADDVSLADACATVLGNSVEEPTAEGVQRSFDSIKNVQDIMGALVMAGGHVGLWGELPPLRKVTVSPELVTRG